MTKNPIQNRPADKQKFNFRQTGKYKMRNRHPELEYAEHGIMSSAEVSQAVDPLEQIEVEPTKSKHFEGLCITCDLLEDCAWQKQNLVTLHCEHYL